MSNLQLGGGRRHLLDRHLRSVKLGMTIEAV